MATDLERMEQALSEGKTLAESLAVTDLPSTPAEAPAAQPGEPAPAPAPDELDPYLTAIPEALRDLVRPALQTMLDGVKQKAAGADEATAQLQAMHRAFQSNPKGALRFLGEHYRVPVAFSDEAGKPAAAPSPQRQDPQVDPDAEIATLKQELSRVENMAQAADLMDRLATLRAVRIVGERVAPVAAAQLSQEEQRQVEALRSANPDIPVDTLLPQIRRRQETLRDRPYLTPEEGMYIELGPALIQQVRRLKTQVTRASTPAERVAAGVSGPGASAPAMGATFDPYNLSADQLMALMQATGGVAPER